VSQNNGIVDEIVGLTSRSARLGVRLFGFTVTTTFRLLNATLNGIAEALKPREEIEAKPPKKEIEREKADEVTKKPRKKK